MVSRTNSSESSKSVTAIRKSRPNAKSNGKSWPGKHRSRNRSRGVSQFSFDENETVPFRNGEVALRSLLLRTFPPQARCQASIHRRYLRQVSITGCRQGRKGKANERRDNKPASRKGLGRPFYPTARLAAVSQPQERGDGPGFRGGGANGPLSLERERPGRSPPRRSAVVARGPSRSGRRALAPGRVRQRHRNRHGPGRA